MKNLLPAIYTLLIAALLCSADVSAAPAGKSVRIVQPDGTSFMAMLHGDEFMKVMTTSGGEAIIQEPDGWYCYATFDESGARHSSGVKVGHKASAAILSASRMIPAEAMAGTACFQTYAQGETAGRTYERRGIVLLVQFPDLRFTFNRNDFEALLGQGYNGSKGAASYFNDQFKGLCSFSFDVSDIITLDKSYMYYGQNEKSASGRDRRASEMVYDACKAADGNTDFSRYDQDHDGIADNIFIIYAGEDEAEGAGDYHIWSHSWYLHSGAGMSLSLDGVMIDRYACASELSAGDISGIGTFCHEYCHTLGLPDMYDTDYMGSGGLSECLWGSTSIMDKGNRNDNGKTPPGFNAIEKEMLGIPQCITIAEEGTYTFRNDGQDDIYYRIDSDTPGEYYLLEYRRAEGWDAYIGGSGLLVYHIDKSGNDSGYGMSAYSRWQTGSNSVNRNPQHQCADLVEALMPASGPEAGATDISSIFFPYGDKTGLGQHTDPAFRFWNGSSPVFDITDITRTGDGISFKVTKTTSSSVPESTVTEKDVFQDAAIIRWSIEPGFNGKAFAGWGRKDGEMTVVEVKPYSATSASVNYALVLEGLQEMTAYSVIIYSEQDGIRGIPADASFTTKAYHEGGRPYIFMKYVPRNADGTFPIGTRLPLRLFNAMDAEAIEWTYDGRPVSPGSNGYFIPESSGTLRATAYFSDGRREIITKEVIIREEVKQ